MWHYDVFICHASEDKEVVARPLATRLREEHLEVWYDEFTLNVGDSLREAIDRGLARSRFAVVVLSPAFFKKNWTKRELNGLVAREMTDGDRVVLPIWHQLGRDEILSFSPPMADVVAVSTSVGLDKVVEHVLRVVRRRPSPLVVARDALAQYGLEAPSVTDEWWLDVVEASNREPGVGVISQREHWGRWSFPLPHDSSDQTERGERLAQVALQLIWTEAANERDISQVSHPNEVLRFIDDLAGLADVCHDYPHYLASYAPQLTIPGFGGPFENDFSRLYDRSIAEKCTSGSALTTNGRPPTCDTLIALRDPNFANYEASIIACNYVQGDSIGGPSTKTFEPIEYAAWLLSEQSSWMPQPVRSVLLRGLADWACWPWEEHVSYAERVLEMAPYPSRGRLHEWLLDLKDEHAPPPAEVREDLARRFEDSKRLLVLPEAADDLARRFLEAGFVASFVISRRERRRRSARP